MKNYSLSPKIEKIVKRNHKLWKNGGKTITWALAFFIIGVMSKSMWDGYWRTHEWSWQTPVIIKLQNPLIIRELKPITRQVVSPIVEGDKTQTGAELRANTTKNNPRTEYEIVMAQKHGKILWNVYQLETQRGKTDWCRNNNAGYGGFGVKESPTKIACYETFEKATERAEYWLVQDGVDKDVASALCRWNLGTPNLANCNYYQSYLSL